MKRICLSITALLVVAACTEQPSTAARPLPGSKPAADLAASANYVPTPGGWYPSSCVHHVPNGAMVDTGGLVTLLDGSTWS